MSQRVTVQFPYEQLLLGLQRLCGIQNPTFDDGTGPHVAAAAIPLLLSTLRLTKDAEEDCSAFVEVGSISEISVASGGKVLQVSLEPAEEDCRAEFLASIKALQKALLNLS